MEKPSSCYGTDYVLRSVVITSARRIIILKYMKYSSEFLFTENLILIFYVPKPRKCVLLLSL